MTQARPVRSPRATAGSAVPSRGRRIQVRRSGVHGKGVFAVAPIRAGERIIEYKGEVI
ncbi:MAG: SET domain-containing protein-lysine N-methyltransferase, partial [Caldimonas sp.]